MESSHGSSGELRAPLHRENGYSYFIARDEHAAAATRVLAESFVLEPMVKALGVTSDMLTGLIERFLPECLGNGLSVIAVPDDAGAGDAHEAIAGVFINRDFRAPLPSGVPEELPWFHPIAAALGTVGAAYEAERPGLSIGEAVELWMVGVLPDTRVVGRGIASTLFRVSAEVARQNGFARCVTECTGHYSQRGAQKAGFQAMARIAYRDFRFEEKPIFADIPGPHTHVIFYEKILEHRPA